MVSRHPGCLGNSMRKMKRNKSSKGRYCASGNEEAYLEIQNFMQALRSYPRRFARTPGVSFEQHHGGRRPMKGNGGSRRAKPSDCDVPKS